jgi:hypothetical protein
MLSQKSDNHDNSTLMRWRWQSDAAILILPGFGSPFPAGVAVFPIRRDELTYRCHALPRFQIIKYSKTAAHFRTT